MVNYIEQTIRSVLNQNYTNLEYIVIDGGSTDGTLDIIEKYKDKLAYFISEPDKGMYDAIRKGFEHSTGDILAWLNADDIYLPGAFLTVGRVFSEYEDICWVNGRNAYLSPEGSLTQVVPKNAIRTKKDILNGWCRDNLLGFLMQEGMFWRKSLMEKAGGLDLRYRYAGDYELWIRFSAYSELAYVNVPLAAFRARQDNLSSIQFSGYHEEVKRIHSGKPEYPGLLWRILPKNNKLLPRLLGLLHIGRATIIYYSRLGGELRRKRVLGNASPYTLSSIKTLF